MQGNIKNVAGLEGVDNEINHLGVESVFHPIHKMCL